MSLQSTNLFNRFSDLPLNVTRDTNHGKQKKTVWNEPRVSYMIQIMLGGWLSTLSKWSTKMNTDMKSWMITKLLCNKANIQVLQ